VPLFTDKATGEAADYEIAPGGRRLGMIGVYDSGDISRELQDCILETTAGAQERLA
jgi:hypothetical protein